MGQDQDITQGECDCLWGCICGLSHALRIYSFRMSPRKIKMVYKKKNKWVEDLKSVYLRKNKK